MDPLNSRSRANLIQLDGRIQVARPYRGEYPDRQRHGRLPSGTDACNTDQPVEYVTLFLSDPRLASHSAAATPVTQLMGRHRKAWPRRTIRRQSGM